MVKWELIMGITPPINELQWGKKIQDYQKFPEYQKFNQNMSVSEFKTIYFWEWLHRFLARLIGIIFIMPFLFFWVKNWLHKKLKKTATHSIFIWRTASFLRSLSGRKRFR